MGTRCFPWPPGKNGTSRLAVRVMKKYTSNTCRHVTNGLWKTALRGIKRNLAQALGFWHHSVQSAKMLWETF